MCIISYVYMYRLWLIGQTVFSAIFIVEFFLKLADQWPAPPHGVDEYARGTWMSPFAVRRALASVTAK